MRRIATSTWLHGALALFLGAALSGCANPPLVLQGTVVSSDDGKHVITVRDERPPNANVELTIIAKADIGAKPQAGDLVRVAYREKDGVKAVSRLMNLTRQTELKKAGGGGH